MIEIQNENSTYAFLVVLLKHKELLKEFTLPSLLEGGEGEGGGCPESVIFLFYFSYLRTTVRKEKHCNSPDTISQAKCLECILQLYC